AGGFVVHAALRTFRERVSVQDQFCGRLSPFHVRRAGMRKSLVIKRSVVVNGHKTSVSLEDDFWSALKEIAREQHVTLSNLVGSIDSSRQQGNLSCAMRLFVLDHYRQRIAAK